MSIVTAEYRRKVVAALMEARKNFTGTDGEFATKFGIRGSVYSQLFRSSKSEGLVSEAKILQIGMDLGVTMNERVWNIVRTEVFERIEEEVIFCQENSKSMFFVDDCEIGKTVTAKYLSRNLKNAFYIDCSQCKTRQLFIRTLARVIGVPSEGKFAEVKARLKYCLKLLPKPIILLDEAGDLDDPAFLDIKELWNDTEGLCGWYMLGADGLRAKVGRGIRSEKVGYREMFSRFGSRYSSIVPTTKEQKMAFYSKLVTDVVSKNCADQAKVAGIVKKCLTHDAMGQIGGLRRADTLIRLHA